MRLVISAVIVLGVTTSASAELLTTMSNRHLTRSTPPSTSVAINIWLEDNDYDFYYRTPAFTPEDLPITISVDADTFIYSPNVWGAGPNITTVWWNNFNRWLTDGVPTGDSASLITLADGGGFGTGKECLAGVVNCDNDFRTVATDFASTNGVDFAGYRDFTFDVFFERFAHLDDGWIETEYVWHLYGEPIPEPSGWLLAVLAGIFCHYHTPNFLRR